MFDIGGWEFLLIAILGIIIVGPKELPGAIRTVRVFIAKTRGLAREFQSGLDEIAKEAELDRLEDDLKQIADPDNLTSTFQNEVESIVDPDSDVRDAMTFDPAWEGSGEIEEASQMSELLEGGEDVESYEKDKIEKEGTPESRPTSNDEKPGDTA